MSSPQRIDAGSSAEIEVVPRGEFLREFRDGYANGQHVTFLGPTRRGKTTLCFQMLKEVISPQRKAIVFAGKPPDRDPTMSAAPKALNLRVIEEWPPLYSPKDRKNNGYMLRPHHTMSNPTADEANLTIEFGAGLRAGYAARASKPIILVVDEAHHVQNELKLRKEIEAPLMRGAPVCAEWLLIQRGRFMTYHAYSAPEHILIANDPDLSNQERYSELGGIDPKMLMEIVNGLKTYRNPKEGNTISEFVYIRRSGPEICIVDVK